MIGLWLTRNAKSSTSQTSSILSRTMVVAWLLASARECTKTRTEAPLFGFVCAGLGNALLLSSHISLASSWSVHNTIRTDHPLVETGPYRWIRHPMYLSFFLLWCAYASLSNSIIIATSFAVPLIECVARVPAEERALLDRIPGYSEYMQRSWRFCPFVC